MENVFNGFVIATGLGLFCREWKFALLTGAVAGAIVLGGWIVQRLAVK